MESYRVVFNVVLQTVSVILPLRMPHHNVGEPFGNLEMIILRIILIL